MLLREIVISFVHGVGQQPVACGLDLSYEGLIWCFTKGMLIPRHLI